jgi:hypothetical protein
MHRSKEAPARPPESVSLAAESLLCLLRTKDGRLAPLVDGRPLKGVGYVSVQASQEGAVVQLSLPAAAVHFESEPDLEREELN